MKLKDDFITRNMGDKQIMVSAGGEFTGMVRSNKSAAFIVDMLKEETTLENIVDAMDKKYDTSRDVITADVKKILDKLRSIDALEE